MAPASWSCYEDLKRSSYNIYGLKQCLSQSQCWLLVLSHFTDEETKRGGKSLALDLSNEVVELECGSKSYLTLKYF